MTGSTHDPDRARQEADVPWWRVLLAPLLDVFRPRAAARCLVGASRPAFVAVMVLSLVAIAVTVVGLTLWADTITGEWGWRPPAQVWQNWHEHAIDGWLGPLEVAFLLMVVLGPCLPAFLAWLNLPLVYGTGSAWRSYKQSFRAATGLLWPLALAVLVCGSTAVVQEHAFYGVPPGALAAQPEFTPLLVSSVSALLLVLWLVRATRALAPGAPDPVPPPRCEGCGYDLTHQPAERRCSECGLDIDASLVAAGSRPGSRWAAEKAARAWWQTTVGVLFRPRQFYRRLQLRTPAAADCGFAMWSYVAIGLCAALWAAAMIVVISMQGNPPPREAWLVIPFAGTAVVIIGTLGCWFGHRLMGALVASVWLAGRALPDFRWAAKVIEYESAFLWVFCAFWGALLSSLAIVGAIVGGPWLSMLLGRSALFAFLPAEAQVLLLGTLGLVGVWAWRYWVAYRAIRWSNF